MVHKYLLGSLCSYLAESGMKLCANSEFLGKLVKGVSLYKVPFRLLLKQIIFVSISLTLYTCNYSVKQIRGPNLMITNAEN